jgi:ATP-dependent RNA helicase DDX46/PRP5
MRERERERERQRDRERERERERERVERHSILSMTYQNVNKRSNGCNQIIK